MSSVIARCEEQTTFTSSLRSPKASQSHTPQSASTIGSPPADTNHKVTNSSAAWCRCIRKPIWRCLTGHWRYCNCVRIPVLFVVLRFQAFKDFASHQLARYILEPLGLTDEDPIIATRIERMAIGVVYVFFKCIVSMCIEYIRNWLLPAITFSLLCVAEPTLFYFAVVWRQAVITVAFLCFNIGAFAVTFAIWIAMLIQIIKGGNGSQSSTSVGVYDTSSDNNGVAYFSLVTVAILVFALLVNSVESAYFVRFLQVTEEAKRRKFEETLYHLCQENTDLRSCLKQEQLHRRELAEDLLDLECMLFPMQLNNSFIHKVSASEDPQPPVLCSKSPSIERHSSMQDLLSERCSMQDLLSERFQRRIETRSVSLRESLIAERCFVRGDVFDRLQS